MGGEQEELGRPKNFRAFSPSVYAFYLIRSVRIGFHYIPVVVLNLCSFIKAWLHHFEDVTQHLLFHHLNGSESLDIHITVELHFGSIWSRHGVCYRRNQVIKHGRPNRPLQRPSFGWSKECRTLAKFHGKPLLFGKFEKWLTSPPTLLSHRLRRCLSTIHHYLLNTTHRPLKLCRSRSIHLCERIAFSVSPQDMISTRKVSSEKSVSFISVYQYLDSTSAPTLSDSTSSTVKL